VLIDQNFIMKTHNTQRTTRYTITNFHTNFKFFGIILLILFTTSCVNNIDVKSIEKVEIINPEIETRNEGDSCFDPNIVDLTDCEFDFQNINATFDDYPGCTFTIEVAFYQCTDLVQIDKWFYIENIRLLSHDCPAFDNDVLLAQQNGTLDQFSLRVDLMLFDAATDFLGSTVLDVATYTFHFVTASCQQYCWFTGMKKGYYFYSYFKTQCGEGCCEIEKVHYFQNGVVVSESVDVTTDASYESCIGNETCNAIGVVFNTDCVFTCDSYL